MSVRSGWVLVAAMSLSLGLAGCPDDTTSEQDTVTTDTVVGDTGDLDSVATDTTVQDTLSDTGSEPDTVMIDTTVVDTAEDTAVEDTTVVDTVEDTTVVDTVEDTTVDDTTVVDTVEDTTVADTSVSTGWTLGYCLLQYPTETEVLAGQPLTVYGRVFVDGLTDVDQTGNDPDAQLLGQVGYGPVGTVPSDDAWTWFDAAPNSGYGLSSPGFVAEADEYAADLYPAVPGAHDLAYRFSGDGGTTWLACGAQATYPDPGYSPGDAGELYVDNPLYIGAYIEGGGNNKALEIFNPTGSDMDLAAMGCMVRVYFNGESYEESNPIALTGVAPANGVWRLCDDDLALAYSCDQPSNASFWNGNDVVALECGGVALDSLGQVGLSSDFAKDVTLRRACAVGAGDPDATDVFDVSDGWVSLAKDSLPSEAPHAPRALPDVVFSGKDVAIVVVDLFANTRALTLRNTTSGDYGINTNWNVCTSSECGALTDVDVTLGPGESRSFALPTALTGDLNAEEVELAVFWDSNYESADSLQAYIAVNAGGQSREALAIAAGVWTGGGFIPRGPSYAGVVASEWGDLTTPSGYRAYADLCSPTALGVYVTGLDGELTLSDGAGHSLTLDADGEATFDGVLSGGTAYDVTVDAAPYYQACVVTNGAGVADGDDFVTATVRCDAKIFFIGDDGVHGAEIWSTDGTTDGTSMLVDLDPDGAFFTTDSYFGPELTVADGAVWFRYDDNGTRLWRADDTGGAEIADASGFAPEANSFASLAGRIYFTGTTAAGGAALWATDGTPDGTVVIADLNTTGNLRSGMVTTGEFIAFVGRDDAGDSELYLSDGTADGTSRQNLNADDSSSPFELSPFGDRVVFSAKSADLGRWVLWITDGTTDGTFQVYDVGFTRSTTAPDGSWVAFRGEESSRNDIWRTDGTAAGTFRISDTNNGSFSNPGTLAFLGDTLVFTAQGADVGFELFTSDGTVDGWSLLADLDDDGSGSPSGLLELDDGMIFNGSGGSGRDLWFTDGTTDGTVHIAAFTSAGGSIQSPLGAVNGVAVIAADGNDGAGFEIWRSDGTPDGTWRATDLNPDEADGYVRFDP